MADVVVSDSKPLNKGVIVLSEALLEKYLFELSQFKGARILGIEHDALRGVWHVVFEHPSIKEETPEGQRPQSFKLVYPVESRDAMRNHWKALMVEDND